MNNNSSIIKYIFYIVLICFCKSQNYPQYEIVIYNDPLPVDMQVHTTSVENRFMAIFNSSMEPFWIINSSYLGMDFKVNQNFLTYYNKIDMTWHKMNSFMIEDDTLDCVNGKRADYHDIQLLNNGSYIIQAYDSMFVDMSSIVEGGQEVAFITGILVIQEFSVNDSLIMEWDAWEQLDISLYDNINLHATEINWMHGNSIDIDVDNNLLISNRRSSEVIKINRVNGDVIWHLGGPLNQFSFINDSRSGFKLQHDVRKLPNGNISLFDNGVTHNPPISRVLEYSINEDEKIAELVWEYIHPDSLLGLAMGSVQVLSNGSRLINWGTINGIGAVITEVDAAKNIKMEIRYPEGYKVYKVRKNDWEFEVNNIPGDTNLDGVIDIIDLCYISNFISTGSVPHSIYERFRYDTNIDNIVDSTDISKLIDGLLFNNLFQYY